MAVIGAVVLVDLLLSFALVRRMRVLQERVGGASLGLPSEGMRPAHFQLRDLTGELVSDEDLTHGSAVAAFVSPGCEPCERVIGELQRLTVEVPTFAFVNAPATEVHAAKELAESLRHLTRVALIDSESPAVRAFAVAGYPTLIAIRDGVVVAAAMKLDPVLRAVDAAPELVAR